MRGEFEQVPSSEPMPKSVELAKLLEQSDDQGKIKEWLGELLASIEQDTGRTFSPDVAALYKKMFEQQCLARIEQLSRVLETIELQKPLSISDENESHYANAVIPTTEGLRIAFSEGQAPGPVRAVIGFGKTLIGFQTDHVKVKEVDFNETDRHNAQERKHLCRHVVGILEKEDIKHLVMRISLHLMPESLLTHDEKEKKSGFVFRGMQF